MYIKWNGPWGVSARIALRKSMMPCSKNIFFASISPKNVGERGEVEKYLGGGWFPDIQKKGRKNFSTLYKPIKLRVKKFYKPWKLLKSPSL